MSSAIVIVWGSCSNYEWVFRDADGNPEDISGDEFAISVASSPAFSEAVFTKIDGVNGKLHMFLSAEATRKLHVGEQNWFRLHRSFPDGCEENTPPIQVHVQ